MANRLDSIETRLSWSVAWASVALIFIGFGTPYVVIVALKPIALELGSPRSVPSFTLSLAYVGTGIGGVAMGWWSDRVGAMWPALLGTVMVGCGAMLASAGGAWQLHLSYGLMVGLLGNAGLFAPLMAHVTRWFDRRRGTALALVASGQQLAGAVWSPLFGYVIDTIGWRATMFWYGVFAMSAMLPLCWLLRHPPPAPLAAAGAGPVHGDAVLGLPANLVQAVLCAAIVCCCVPMAMPMGHIVALCSDLGYLPARGAEMLSLLLASAFLSRMIWGRLSDRVGGLETVLIGATCQGAVLALYVVVDGLAGLYVVSAAFGLAFGGIIPSYALAVRELFPSADAGWRIATVLLFGLSGMALGGWLGGYVYDLAGHYQPAFAVGVAVNLVNLMLIGFLLLRRGGGARPALAAARAG